MDFSGWKRKLESEGVYCANQPLGPYLSFYIRKTISGRIDYARLFGILDKAIAVAGARVRLDSAGGEGYELTVSLPAAVKMDIEPDPENPPKADELLEYADERLAEMYDEGLEDDATVKSRLEQIRGIKRELEDADYCMAR